MIKGYALLAIIAVSTRLAAAAPKDCVGAWENLGDCSKTCGCGVQRRKYVVSQLAEEGGKACEFEAGEVSAESCTLKECPNMNGAPSSWSECSAVCGEGKQTRSWIWEDSSMEGEAWPENGGPYERSCNQGPCCKVSEFGEFGACNAECGEGLQFSEREILVEGYGCPELLVKNRTCKISECPFTYVVVPNTECSGKTVLAEELEGFGSGVAGEPSCVSGKSQTECLKKCEGMDSCAGVDIAGGKCCFLSEVTDETYHDGKKSSNCYKKPVVDEDVPADAQSAIESVGAFVVCAGLFAVFVKALMQCGNGEAGHKKLPETPAPARFHGLTEEPEADRPTPGPRN